MLIRIATAIAMPIQFSFFQLPVHLCFPVDDLCYDSEVQACISTHTQMPRCVTVGHPKAFNPLRKA